MNSKRCFCHSRNSVSFRSSLPVTQEKDQICFLLYHSHILCKHIMETLFYPVQSLEPVNSSFIIYLALCPPHFFLLLQLTSELRLFSTQFLCIHLVSLLQQALITCLQCDFPNVPCYQNVKESYNIQRTNNIKVTGKTQNLEQGRSWNGKAQETTCNKGGY